MQEVDNRRFLGRRRDREEACFICGHYHDHENGEPCATCGHVMAPSEAKAAQIPGVIPTTVIPGELYLGSYDTASRSELLKTMGITHILNTVPACQSLFKNTFIYHTVSESPPDFQECFDFIESARKAEGKTLIFCMSGISRSPTVVISYLMRHRGWRLAESYKWVKEKRDTIKINPDDTKRLADLELKMYKACSIPNGLSALQTTGNMFSLSPSMPSAPMACNVPQAPSLMAAAPGPPAAPFSNGSSWTMNSPATFSFGSGPSAHSTIASAPAFVFGSPTFPTPIPAMATAGGPEGPTESAMES